jgi:hypothetical protein
MLKSEVLVEGVSAQDVVDVLLHPNDERYQAWWPGTHLEYHLLEPGPAEGHVGDVVLMDEYIGSRRVRMVAEVLEVIPAERLLWQLRRFRLRLPIWLSVELGARGDGVLLRHTITAGWSGRARLFDPLWRLYFSRSFARAMDRHVRTEFPLIRHLPPRDHPDGVGHPQASPGAIVDPVRQVR